MLFEAGALKRLGTVVDGTTLSDHEPDEREREMSIGASVACFEHDGREINLIDTPGEPSFVADATAALRVADAAVVVVNAVTGVEVNTERLWRRADAGGLARLVFVNMLDRERADFFVALGVAEGSLRPARRRYRDPDRRRAGRARGDRPDRHGGLRLRGRQSAATRRRSRSPRSCAARPRSTARS